MTPAESAIADAPLQSGPRRAPVSLAQGIAAFLMCMGLWAWLGFTSFPADARLQNKSLFDAVARVLPPYEGVGLTIWIINQDSEPHNLTFRKMSYAAQPHRTPMLPFYLRPTEALAAESNIPVDPADKPYAVLGRMAHFATPDAMHRYARHFGVTHLLITGGDAEVSRLVGAPLLSDHCYLFSLSPDQPRFWELARARLD